MRFGPVVLYSFVLATSMGADVYRFGKFEKTFTAATEYSNPLKDVEAIVEFGGPGNIKDVVPAFWDGGKTWKVRYSPEASGSYSYTVKSADHGLNGQTGKFSVADYKGTNSLYAGGTPRLSADRHYLVQANNQPWFYLADTAWNGALLSTDSEWKRYLADRAAKRFTAVQIVMTQWRAGLKDENGQVAYQGTDPITINPQFFERMDRRIDAINDAGLVAVPVMLWAMGDGTPGVALPAAQATLLAKYMAARYGANQVIWMLGGDGDYTGDQVAKWKSIGEAVFPAGRKRSLVGMHPRGMQDPWAPFRSEGWLDIFFFQTGHGSGPAKWQWNATKGMNTDWNLEPYHPVIDAEPNYEGHLSYQGKQRIGDAEVRRAAYYSLLAGQTAGIGYGAHGIWSWARTAAEPLNHKGTGIADPWEKCLNYPGAQQMTVLRSILDSIEWWRLRPERYLVRYENYDEGTFDGYIMSSLSERGDIGMMYLPGNPDFHLNLSRFEGTGKVVGTWVDPRTGKRTEAGSWDKNPDLTVKTPGPGDWVLLLQMK